jgi:hypothetical protein
MFCIRCGTDLPDDSQFCRKCGQAQTGGTTAAAVAPVAAGRRRSLAIWLFIIVVLVVAIAAIWQKANEEEQTRQQARLLAAQTAPQLHTVTIGTGAITIGALNSSYFTLPVPAGATIVKIQGHFTATGGLGNDIEVYVLNQDEFTNWQNGHATSTRYNSGRVTAGEVATKLPDGTGTYYVIFNNKFSLLSPKAVQENVTMTFYSR